ncbi:MAG TPA: AraC family transcriptional regulator [Thermoanaerobaculia bacterium]
MATTRLTAGRFFGYAREERESESFSFVERTPELREREVPLHTHDEAHFVYIVRGLYVTESFGAPEVCSTGALVFNPRGTTHRDRFRSDDGVFFTIGVAPAVASMLERPLPRASFFRAPHVVAAMGRAYREYRESDSLSTLALESLGLELAGCASKSGALDDAQAPPGLIRARDYLRETLPVPRISDAARVAGVHPVHLARAFRKHFRCSPGDFLRECRLERAKALLRDARLSLADVADASGFCDQSELTHAFRRTFGWTPREFRALL